MAKRTAKKAHEIWVDLEIKLNNLNQNIFPNIKKNKIEIENYYSELLIDSDNSESIKTKIVDLEEKIQENSVEAKSLTKEILDLHKEIFEGEELDGEDSIQTKLRKFLSDSENLFTETEKKKEDFDVFYDKVFGEKNIEDKRVGGLEKEINKYEARYKTLFDRIESLLPGATTAGLAKVFSDKVTEYKKTVSIWTWISFGLLIALITNYLIFPIKAENISQTYMGLLNRLPFVVFAVWAVVFAGNRRAEGKKLEESYKHKEVMARSFVGYKEQIEELEESETDKILLKTHMKNLLEAINDNSGDFLDKTGDKSPLHEAMDSIKSVAKKKVEITSSLVDKNEKITDLVTKKINQEE